MTELMKNIVNNLRASILRKFFGSFCDKCGKVFELQDPNISASKEKRLDHLYICPFCGEAAIGADHHLVSSKEEIKEWRRWRKINREKDKKLTSCCTDRRNA